MAAKLTKKRGIRAENVTFNVKKSQSTPVVYSLEERLRMAPSEGLFLSLMHIGFYNSDDIIGTY